MIVLEVIAWVALGLILWTHLGYPALAWAWARVRPARVAAADVEPRVALVIAAHNEADVIAARLDNALALDYPRDRLRIVVASDASDDGTDEIVRGYADRGVELVRAERGGKVHAQDTAVRALGDAIDVLAFSDANCAWQPDALRRLVRPFADERVAYACGRLSLRRADGTNLEGAYWRYEVALRGWEAKMGSVTGGNGSIYAVRRERYLFVDPRFGHDLSFPYRMVQDGWIATYAPDAVANEKPSAGLHDEFRRKVRMFGHCWLLVFHGRMFSLRREGPRYWLQMVSHRLLRYASGLLHLVLLLATLILAARVGGPVWMALLVAQLAVLGVGAASSQLKSRWRPLAIVEYYLLVTIATVIALWEAVVRGIEPVWERAEGTR